MQGNRAKKTFLFPFQIGSKDGWKNRSPRLPFQISTDQIQTRPALAKEPGRVFTREALLSEVWGYRPATDTRLVNVHIQRLRAKVEADPEDPKIILTVRGVGYKAGAAS